MPSLDASSDVWAFSVQMICPFAITATQAFAYTLLTVQLAPPRLWHSCIAEEIALSLSGMSDTMPKAPWSDTTAPQREAQRTGGCDGC